MKQGLVYVSVFLVSCLGARYVGMSEPMSDLASPEQLPERGLGLFRNATDFRQETWVEELAALPESGAPGFEHLREPMQGLAQAEWVGRSLETGVEAFLQRVLESSWSTKLRRAVAKQARHAYPYAYLSDGVALDAGKHQVKLVLALLKQLTGGDEVAMRALVRRYQLDALVPGLLVAMNPLASLAAANAVTTPGERARRMQEAYEMWTQSDAAASWSHALNHVEGPERRRLLSTIYSTGKRYDIAGTFSMWESILEELPGHDEEMLVRLATSYALKDPVAAIEAASELPNDWRRESYLWSLLNGNFDRKAPKQMLEALPVGTEVRRSGLPRIVEGWAWEDQEACEAWIATWTDDAEIAQAYESIAGIEASRKRTAEREEMKNQIRIAPGPTDQEIAVRRWVDFDEGDILSLIAATEARDQRRTLVDRWLERHPEEALAYLETTDEGTKLAKTLSFHGGNARKRLELWRAIRQTLAP